LRDDIPLNISNVIKKYNNDLNNFYYSTNSGYINLGTTLFSGFARETYFSLDKTKIDNLINTASRLKNIEIGSIKLEDNVLEGYANNISENSVHLSSKYPLILKGRKAENPLEIVISSKMNEELGGNTLDKNLFVTTLSSKIEEEFITKNYFRVVKLSIVGIADSAKNTIYNDPNFSISLFRDLFQFSSFDIITNSIVFELDGKISSAQINSLNKTLEFYKFTDPLDDFKSGIDETLSFLEYALIVLAIVTLFSSIVLIGIINYINIVEAKRDFSILFVLGFSLNEILKMQFIHSLIPNLLSFFFGSFSIILMSNIIGELLTEKLGISTIFYVNFKPFLIMFLAIILVSLLSVIMSIAPIKKINITKELH
jgi:ABC-type antimicrobial peptide transport system permease subunit